MVALITSLNFSMSLTEVELDTMSQMIGSHDRAGLFALQCNDRLGSSFLAGSC